MKLYLHLNRDEVREKIPYELVAETFAREIHKTGRGKRIFNEMFDESEKTKIRELRSKASAWAFRTGCPDNIKITPKTLALWYKLAEYCMRL